MEVPNHREQPTPTTQHYEISTPRSDQQSNDTADTVVVEVPSVPAPAPHAISYRPDIDGLRCLAVVPVVIYHAYPTSIPGGFTGVDIFFVISGYLISGILFKENKNQKFTYSNFYSRRIRRIFPGLILVLIFTIVAGCLWYITEPLQNMAATLWAGAVFGANIQVLTLKQTYFSASVKEDPLLHLWSLGVEEQFYIFWPLFVTLLSKLSFRKAFVAQVVFMVASFVLNILFLGYNGNNNWSFYFPFCRFWQMSIGGLLAFVNMTDSTSIIATRPSWLISSGLAMIGMAMVVVGFVCIDDKMPFPGYWSLLPTFGAALLIYSGPDTYLHRFLLALRPCVWIGQISYALYLWHWPLLVYAKARFPNDDLRPWSQEPYMMVVYSVLASAATLYIVENNLRRRKSKFVVPMLFGLMMCIAALGIVIEHNAYSFSVLAQPKVASTGPIIIPSATSVNGTVLDELPNMSKPPRYQQPTVAKILSAKDDFQPDGPEFHTIDTGSPYIPTSENMILNMGQTDKLVIVLGDSHGHMVKPRFASLYYKAVNASEPFPTMVFKTRNGHPPSYLKPKAVFYSLDWPQWIRPNSGASDHPNGPICCTAGYVDSCPNQSPNDAKAMIASFQQEISAFAALGIKIFAATLNPEGPQFAFTNMLNGNSVGAVAPVSKKAYKATHADLIAMVEGAVKSVNGTIIDYSDNQCWGDVCEVISNVGEPIFRDNDHFRPGYVAKFLSVLDQVAKAGV
ncbi:acyltransferase 3 [Thraustotheca clavata]|uniref:Acyltransferase 3 n=1 Tax=Thraustotheca clavata TaxID=74557 RepID=A0A1W0A0H6_9STRA|nr:acyltransferase 3 [Thraustotheca clavata]